MDVGARVRNKPSSLLSRTGADAEELMVPGSSPVCLNALVCPGRWSWHCLTELGQFWESTLTITSNIDLSKTMLHSMITFLIFLVEKDACVFIYVYWKVTSGYKMQC